MNKLQGKGQVRLFFTFIINVIVTDINIKVIHLNDFLLRSGVLRFHPWGYR